MQNSHRNIVDNIYLFSPQTHTANNEVQIFKAYNSENSTVYFCYKE